MPREQLKPGEHGKFSFAPTPDGQVRARARVCLLDNSVVQVTRIGKNEATALSKLQKAIAERLGAASGSSELAPNSKVGLACRQWIDELRERSRWPNPPVRPQTVDEYERLLGNHVNPYLGHYRLNQLTPAICQTWVDGIARRGQAGGHDMVATAIQAHGRFADVIDRAVVHDGAGVTLQTESGKVIDDFLVRGRGRRRLLDPSSSRRSAGISFGAGL